MKTLIYSSRKTTWLFLLCGVLLNACRNESQTPPPVTEAPKPTPPAESPTAPAPFNNPNIRFEHFGNFDLSTWQNTPAKLNDSEGDVVTEIVEYTKDSTKMTVETAQSEYGHSVTHTLKGSDGKVQKVRVLEITNETKKLVETVQDYTLNPAKKFTRTQKVDKSWQQLTPLPTAATGEWKESVADKLEP